MRNQSREPQGLSTELEDLRRRLAEAQEGLTRQRLTEEALRESEARFRLLFDASPDAVVIYNQDGTVLDLNQAFANTYGWSREECLGKLIDFVPPEEVEVTKQAILETLAGRNVEFETRRRTKDGRLLDVQINTAPYHDPQGDLTGIYVIHRDVTARNKSEAALRESERRYRQLLTASPDPITVYDHEGRVVYVNPAFEQAFGWTQEELAGKGIDFVPPHEVERTRDAVARTLRGENVLLESQRLTKDGRLLDIQLKTAMFTDPDGKLAGDIVIYRDISQRKRAEEALRASQERYRLLLDTSPDPITVYDHEGGVVYVNPAFEQAFGWSQGELAGKGIDFVPPHEVERTREAVARTLRGENVLLESQRLTKDGRLLDIQLKTAIFTDREGKLAGDIVIYRDISQRKRAEEELKRHRDRLEEMVEERTSELSRANRDLQAEIAEHKRTAQALVAAEGRYRRLYQESVRAEALYRSLFNSSPDAIIVYGMNGRVQFLNPSFTQIFGWTQEELANRRLDFVPDSERESTHQAVNVVIQEGRQRRDFQTKRFTKDGRLLDVNISASRFDDHQGNPAGMVVIIRDTTEQLRSQRERERLEVQLRQAQKMEAVGVLASGIAHDFNNILQVATGYLQRMLTLDDPGVDPYRQRLREMDRLMVRGANLVRGLLTFGRKVTPELSVLDLNQALTHIVEVLAHTIPKMVRIETSFAADLKPIRGDANQIEQLLMNLASNARDAMPGGGRLLVETMNYSLPPGQAASQPGLAPGDYVLLKVSDTGCGMDRETLQHIFEPFFTTKIVGKGTGMGLSTVYGIVQGHGGHINCYSEVGRGTVFNIYLPVLAKDDARREPDPQEKAPLPGGEETILLVDDEAAILEVASELLLHYGYRVLTAASGEEALSAYSLHRGEISLVILDLGMPGMGGQGALEGLLKLDPRARILIASGYSGDNQVTRCLGAGAADFIPKPYRLDDLLRKVRGLLDQT